MRVHLLIPNCKNRPPCFGTFGEPREAFWLTATEKEVEESLLPLLDETCAKRYDEWRSDPRRVKEETLDGRWSFLVPARVSREDPPMFFFRVFPYSAMNHEKGKYRRIPGEQPYGDSNDPWLKGVEVGCLSELAGLLAVVSKSRKGRR